jgi:hypothetical protein
VLAAAPSVQSTGAKVDSRMTAKTASYDYLDYDSAYFRRPAGNGPVTEIWHKEERRWVPYTGSGTKIAMYGDYIKPGALPLGAAEAP